MMEYGNKSRIDTGDVLDFTSLLWLQKPNTKDASKIEEKMLIILKEGIQEPFDVWRSPEDGQVYILDGHHLQSCLFVITNIMIKGEKSDYAILYPNAYDYIQTNIDTLEPPQKEQAVVYHNCKDREEAVQFWLNKQKSFARLTQAGMGEFLLDEGFDEEGIFDAIQDEFTFIDDYTPFEGETEFDSVSGDATTSEGGDSTVNVLQEITADQWKELKILAGYQTASSRKSVSKVVRYLEEENLLLGDVLDYGGGKDLHDYPLFDPYYNPDYELLTKKYDTIICSLVLDILPMYHSRYQTLETVKGLLKKDGRAFFAVNQKNDIDVITTKGFQSGWDLSKWLEFFEVFCGDDSGFDCAIVDEGKMIVRVVRN